jgi:hypothetical protein
LLSSIVSTGYSTEQQDLKYPVLGSIEFYTWTLTHITKAFSKIQPIFSSPEELRNYLLTSDNEGYCKAITTLANLKINNEWRAWMNVHSDMPIDECKLDNMLMMALYRLIINRDSRKCVSCDSQFDLTIHHIIPKQRNYLRRVPPFGRSVPTNLITLCKDCHWKFDPLFV